MEQVNMDQFTEDAEIASPTADAEIASLTDDELRARIALYQNILESRKPVNMVSIDWEGSVQDIRKGKPYFAVLTNENGCFHYEFMSTISYDSKKFNATATAVFRGDLPVGTIVRYRSSASWKNDHSYYGMVEPEGISEITEIEAKRALKIIK